MPTHSKWKKRIKKLMVARPQPYSTSFSKPFNVAKHARASRLNVIVTASDNELIINIQDIGVGITKESHLKLRSFGILDMQVRVKTFNGSPRITGLKPKGTTVSIKFSLRAAAN